MNIDSITELPQWWPQQAKRWRSRAMWLRRQVDWRALVQAHRLLARHRDSGMTLQALSEAMVKCGALEPLVPSDMRCAEPVIAKLKNLGLVQFRRTAWFAVEVPA